MRSDNVTKGMQQAPHRSLFNALGYTKEELDRPLVGIVSSYNEIVPGHMNLDKIVDAVKMGVAMAGGTPIVFPAIAVCDGIAMGSSNIHPSGAYIPNSQSSSAFRLSSECSISLAYRQESSSTSCMDSFFPFSIQRTIKNS